MGVYSVNASYWISLLALFGVIGYALREAGFKPAPLILAMVIGPMIENSMRQAMNISGGNLGTVLIRPIWLALYILTIVVFTVPPLIKQLKKCRA